MSSISCGCHSCAHHGTTGCGEKSQEPCGEFVSWADYWRTQIAVVDRALHNTYAAAAVLLLGIVTIGIGPLLMR